MDVELGRGLGDDLAGFDGFDELFGPYNSRGNTPDFFKFCPLEDQGVGTGEGPGAEVDVGPITTAPPSPGSSGRGSRLTEGDDREFVQDGWKHMSSNHSIGVRGAISAVGIIPIGIGTNSRGCKVRGRKRSEDSAVESLEEASSRPIPKRRSSAAAAAQVETAVKVEHLIAIRSSNNIEQQKQNNKPASSRSHSFRVLNSAEWNAPSLDRASSGTAIDTKPYAGVGALDASTVVTGKDAASLSLPTTKVPTPARGGAIKVKQDVLSRPRISVFMSKPRPQRPSSMSANPKLAAALSLDTSSSLQNFGHGHGGALINTAALPGSYGRTMTMLEPPGVISRATSGNRFKDLRITVGRPRSQAEQNLVETTPPVVPMGVGTRRGSSPGLDDMFGPPPTLQRATSVGALTIPGSGDVFSPIPMSPATGVLPTYELSDKLQGGASGQRRNLTCKVFGSPVNRPSRGPGN